jgi:hypothetical protein
MRYNLDDALQEAASQSSSTSQRYEACLGRPATFVEALINPPRSK